MKRGRRRRNEEKILNKRGERNRKEEHKGSKEGILLTTNVNGKGNKLCTQIHYQRRKTLAS